MCRMVLKRDSEKETAFLLSVSKGLSQLNFSSLDSTASLNLLSEAISRLFADCWATYVKKNTITTRSKEWWNNECRTVLETYRRTRERSDWFSFCSATRQTKQYFFDNRIAKIASTNKQPWDLMSWVKQRKLLVVKAICFQEQSCNDLLDLWSALHQSYNATADCSIDLSVLDEVPSQAVTTLSLSSGCT